MTPDGGAQVDARALLQRHLAGEDVSAEVQELVGADATLAPLLEMISHARGAEERRDEAGADDSVTADAYAADLRHEREVIDLVRAELSTLTDDVRSLQGTLEDLAGALGACPVCVGARADCVLCHGRGGPGWIPPNPAAFCELVLPALRAHQYARRLPARRRPPEQPVTSAGPSAHRPRPERN